MERKIVFTPYEPDKNLLWLHRIDGKLNLQSFGPKGWESVGEDITEEELEKLLGTKADLVGGKVPTEQLPSYVDDVIEFYDITDGKGNIDSYLNNYNYYNKIYFVQANTVGKNTLAEKYNKKFVNFGANKSEEDWTTFNPEIGKIYIATSVGVDANHTYRYTGYILVDLHYNLLNDVKALQNKTFSYNITVTDINDLSAIKSGYQYELSSLYKGFSESTHNLINISTTYDSKFYTFIPFDIERPKHNENIVRFKVFNNNYIQTYELESNSDNISFIKVSEVIEHAFFDGDDVENNKQVISKLEVGKTIPAFLKGEFIYYGFATKTRTITNLMMCLNTEFRLYSINNTSGILSPIKVVRLTDIALYDEIRGSKTTAEAKRELTNLIKGNTAVLDASKLGTALTDAEGTAVQNATTLILTNYNGRTLPLTVGYKDANQVWFLGIDSSSGGQVNTNRVIYTISTKTCEIVLNIANPYQWYMAHGGTVSDQNNFGTINAFLYNHTFIIDEALLGTTITDTAIQDGIKRASLLIVSNTDPNRPNEVYHVDNSTNRREFVQIHGIGELGGISLYRISYDTVTNVLSTKSLSIIRSPYDLYNFAGGTKYTTEADFNAAFVAVMDGAS